MLSAASVSMLMGLWGPQWGFEQSLCSRSETHTGPEETHREVCLAQLDMLRIGLVIPGVRTRGARMALLLGG